MYVHSISWQATGASASQEIPLILCSRKVNYHIYNSPSIVPILSQMGPIHATQLHTCLSRAQLHIAFSEFTTKAARSLCTHIALPAVTIINLASLHVRTSYCYYRHSAARNFICAISAQPLALICITTLLRCSLTVLLCIYVFKFHPTTGHKDTQGNRYDSTHSVNWVLDEGGWSTPRPGRFTPGKETRYPLYRRLCGPQGRSGRVQ